HFPIKSQRRNGRLDEATEVAGKTVAQFRAGLIVVESGKPFRVRSGARRAGGSTRGGLADRGAFDGEFLIHSGAARISGKEPKQNVDSQYDRASATEEKPRPVPHVANDDPQQRSLVRWQLHDQQGSFAPEQSFFEEPGHEQSDND